MTKASKTSANKKPAARGRKRTSKVSEILIYRDKYIVVDTNSYFIYIGKLQEVSEGFVTLKDADVHDCRESPSMNEKYILDSKKYGVRSNRKLVHLFAAWWVLKGRGLTSKVEQIKSQGCV
jgi:hypothetical protein